MWDMDLSGSFEGERWVIANAEGTPEGVTGETGPAAAESGRIAWPDFAVQRFTGWLAWTVALACLTSVAGIAIHRF